MYDGQRGSGHLIEGSGATLHDRALTLPRSTWAWLLAPPASMMTTMSASEETVVLTIPRAFLPELPALSKGLTDRMHALLERNTDGALTATEREELEALVQMAQFAQVLAMAAQGGNAR